MKKVLFILATLFTFLMNNQTPAQTPKDFAELWDKQHFSIIPPSQVKHMHLKTYLDGLKKNGLKVDEVGRSFGDREIYQIEWGKGETKIFMWSQMHGNEPTATSALIDMFTILHKNRDQDWVKKLEETLTIRAVPMLNPDGAELYQRYNLQSIDINRDAQALETPEGRLLKRLRDEWSPDIGFNLHNQNQLTTVGFTDKQATISLLAVLGNAEGISNGGFERSKRLCAVIVTALENFIKGNIARYDNSYNGKAFGDNFSAWGTPVILIETGGLKGKDELYLVKLNVVAYLSALQALADGSEKTTNPNYYEYLPENNSGRLFNYIFRNANIVNFAETDEIFQADVGVNAERRRAGESGSSIIREIGDLSDQAGLEEFDVKKFYLVAKTGNLKVGERTELLFYKKKRKIDWKAENLTEKFSPDAVFSGGRWVKPLKK